MDHFAVSFQIARVVRFVIALFTVKSFDSLMHSFDVIVKEMLVNGLVIAKVAGKFFTFLMLIYSTQILKIFGSYS